MQADRHRHGITKRAGYRKGFKQGRNLRFAGDSVQAFTDVEDQIPAVSDSQATYQLPHMSDAIGFVPEGPNGVFQRIDGVRSVEFRRRFFVVTFSKVHIAQVVSQSDLHAAALSDVSVLASVSCISTYN